MIQFVRLETSRRPSWSSGGRHDAYLLVSFKTRPRVQRIAIALREKNGFFEFGHITSDSRPDLFLAISPHKTIPVLGVDGKASLFEWNAIAEYLDETIAPRLYTADPIEGALNRAWADYVPTLASGFITRVTSRSATHAQGRFKWPSYH